MFTPPSLKLNSTGVRTYCFDDISSNMHYKGGKSAKFCLFKMIILTKIAFLDLILPISRRYDHFFANDG